MVEIVIDKLAILWQETNTAQSLPTVEFVSDGNKALKEKRKKTKQNKQKQNEEKKQKQKQKQNETKKKKDTVCQVILIHKNVKLQK